MDIDPVTAYEGFGLSSAQLTLILVGVIILPAIPILVALSAILKLRRFPALRPLHWLLLIAALLTGTLGLIEHLAPAIPLRLRASGLWIFLWLFAMAWLAVTWTRSAIKTRLRPRGLDIATLICVAAIVLALGLPMAGLL